MGSNRPISLLVRVHNLSKVHGLRPLLCNYWDAPLLPFDIIKANYLLPPPNSLLSTGDLIAL